MTDLTLTVPVATETLSADEISEITGRSRRDHQLKWLTDNGWRHAKNAAGAPIVGRLYARLKLAGIDLRSAEIGQPDFSKVR